MFPVRPDASSLAIQVPKYFISIDFSETTQLEDPRQEWRAIQEAMLREYLQTAQDVLEVSPGSPSFLIIIHVLKHAKRR